jgi:hypothetical protein
MRREADIVITGPDGRLAAVIELKNRRDLTPEIAAGVRRGVLVRGGVRSVPYFLVLSGETGCLWKEGSAEAAESRPELCFPVGAALRRYFPDAAVAPPTTEAQLSLMVFQWLAELVDLSEEPTGEPERSLAKAGFLRAIRGGTVAREALV